MRKVELRMNEQKKMEVSYKFIYKTLTGEGILSPKPMSIPTIS